MQSVGPDFLFDNPRANVDDTILYLGIIHLLLRHARTVVDVGCGRGAYADNHRSDQGFDLRGTDRRVIGIDIDPRASENPYIDEFYLLEDGKPWPVASGSVDLLVSDWTFEHVTDPGRFAKEISRVVRPGGAFVARSVSYYSMLSAAARRIPNSRHPRLLRILQPSRQSRDVFPTAYRLNTVSQLDEHFRSDFDFTISWRPGLENYLRSRSPGLARVVAAIESRLPDRCKASFVICGRRRAAETHA